jgi:hypothetical protein
VIARKHGLRAQDVVERLNAVVFESGQAQ